MPRYKRFLSDLSCCSLGRDGPLNFLVADSPFVMENDEFALDVHSREKDALQFYHGTTFLLRIEFKKGGIRMKANKAYKAVSGFQPVMKTFSFSDSELFRSGALKTDVNTYLKNAVNGANPRYYRNKREGYWQNQVAIEFGRNWNPTKRWLVVDREAVVGFPSDTVKTQFYNEIKAGYLELRSQLTEEFRWANAAKKGLGDELDLLAIGPDREIVCLELKHGQGSGIIGVYYGTLQAAVYRDAFQKVLPRISEDIKKLVRQKVELGLLPPTALQRLPSGDFCGVVSNLVVAEPQHNGQCWNRLAMVMERCEKARMPVFGIDPKFANPVRIEDLVNGIPQIICRCP